jgi:hypothetical protein
MLHSKHTICSANTSVNEHSYAMLTDTSSPLSVRWYDPSKVRVSVYQQTERNIPEDLNQQQHYKNLKSHHQLMLHRKKIIVCSDSHKNKIHTHTHTDIQSVGRM